MAPARLLARGFALVALAPGLALAQLAPSGWAISGSNTVRVERYDASGDRAFVPYPVLGGTGYDELTITGLARPSPYSLTRFLVSALANDSSYRSQQRGFVPERLNFLAESGEHALAWRAEAGDFFAFTTMRTQQRSLKGVAVELQPPSAPGVRQSVLLFAGAAQPGWRTASWSDDNSIGASWLVDTDRFGRWNANLLRNERGPDPARGLPEERSQTVASFTGETLFELAAWKVRVEAEVARMKGDHDFRDADTDGRNRSDSGYFAQLSVFDALFNARLRAERYGRDYRPFGAVTPADRRSLEAHAGWQFPQGIALRARLQEYSDQHESANPLVTRVAGANVSGAYAPWLISGALDAFVQDARREDRTLDSRFSQVSMNLSRPLPWGWVAQVNAMRLDVRDRAASANSVRTSQLQAGATIPVAWGPLSGSVTPGVLYRDVSGARATRDWQPTLAVALYGGPHRFSANLARLAQDPRLDGAAEVATINMAFDYRFRWGRHEFGVDAIVFDRRPTPGAKSEAYRIGASWTWSFDAVAGSVARTSVTSPTATVPLPDVLPRSPALLARVAPGQELSAVQRALAAGGFGAGTAGPRVVVYEARIIGEVEQRQRLAITHEAGLVERVALVINLEGAADAARVYERVRRALLDSFGAPAFALEEGAWGANLAPDLAAGRFIRITEWGLPTGVLRLGIPRRLDGALRIEVQHARTSSSPRDAGWSLEAVR